MQDNKKVYMILTNGFDPDVRVYKEAKYLVEKGFDVKILCWDRKCDYKDKENEEMEGIKIKRFFIPSTPGSGLKQILPYFKFMLTVRKYLKDKNYKYLHCHDFDGILVGMCTKKKKGKTIVFDIHEIYTHYAYAKNIFFNKIFNKVINKSNYIIYVNEDQIQNIKDKDKLIYLPNYPEEKIYVPIEKKKSERIRVNYIGSVRDYNALKTLLEIDNKNIEVGIYGTGTCYEKLKEEYKEKNANLYGKYDGINDSGEIYRNTDIVYCSYNPDIPNWKTAFPVKAFEAIITLTPIIVSENTVIGDFVKKYGIGEVIDYSNIQSIINAISKISNNYGKYVNRIKEITKYYNWNQIVTQLNIVYK